MKRDLAIYLHWPFCLSKCPYCDFNSRVMPHGEDQKKWEARYKESIQKYAALLPNRTITSVYFGGGTPSLMESGLVAALVNEIAKRWPLNPDCEITLEANPTSSESEKFKAFKAAGVNRLSLGVQALDDAALHFLGRTHDVAQATKALHLTAETFDRFSFDLIYARAGQTIPAWEAELEKALSFGSKHMSLYQLTLEEGSVFYKRPDRGDLVLDEPLAADMFEMTNTTMTRYGLPPYEVSNYAVQGQESRHNMTYWKYQDYIGLGPGAHGRYLDSENNRMATVEEQTPTLWLEGHAPHAERLNREEAQIEAFMMGLRLTQGIDKKEWKEKFNQDIESILDRAYLREGAAQQLIFNTKKRLAVTEKGRLLLNLITAHLLA